MTGTSPPPADICASRSSTDGRRPDSPPCPPTGGRSRSSWRRSSSTTTRTTTRIWLAGPDGDPAPVTAGPHDANPVVVARRPVPRLHVVAQREGGRVDAARDAGRAGRARCARSPRCPSRIDDVAWSPDGAWLALRQPHPRRALRGQGRAVAAAAAGSRRSSPASTTRAGSSTARRTCTSCAPTARAPCATSRPGRSSTTASPGWPTRRRRRDHRRSRHEGWDLDLAEDLYVVPLDGEIRALTKQTGGYSLAVGVARRLDRSRSSASTTPPSTRRTPRSA